MIVRLSALCRDVEREAVLRAVGASGYVPHVVEGPDGVLIGALGDGSPTLLARLRDLAGVEAVVDVARPFGLSSRSLSPFGATTVVPFGSEVHVGGRDVIVIAGPCAVEGRDQLLSTARHVKDSGARALRGGAFKPRTSPYAFQGLGVDGLALLAEARAGTGLPIVTEVMSPSMVETVAASADVLQVGARNMQNYDLLREVGRMRRPVLLKRAMSGTIEELLLAAEYVLAAGNPHVVLCERGIRTFERATRNTLDLSAVPVLKAASHLPVIVDPSHGTGARALVLPMALAAIAAGADGLVVEVHPAPERALSDGPQSLGFEAFTTLVERCRRVAEAVERAL
ncbi:MAG: hypothetical protein RL199_1084 [Pseudomonadota bacterium]